MIFSRPRLVINLTHLMMVKLKHTVFLWHQQASYLMQSVSMIWTSLTRLWWFNFRPIFATEMMLQMWSKVTQKYSTYSKSVTYTIPDKFKLAFLITDRGLLLTLNFWYFLFFHLCQSLLITQVWVSRLKDLLPIRLKLNKTGLRPVSGLWHEP